MDLFSLTKHQTEIVNMDGFGRKSYDNLCASIEASRDVKAENFIYALGIKHVGLENAKRLCKFFAHDLDKIAETCTDCAETLLMIDGYGESIVASLHEYFEDEENYSLYKNALETLRVVAVNESSEKPLYEQIYVITGSLNTISRNDLKALIESKGGRVSGSVSAKTTYLINNDSNSTSGKNKDAKRHGIPIITEEQFFDILKEGMVD